jgi:hypothetical protein
MSRVRISPVRAAIAALLLCLGIALAAGAAETVRHESASLPLLPLPVVSKPPPPR